MLTAIHADAMHSAAAQSVVSPKLVNAAHEFEAQLMKELMKPLTSGSAPGSDSDDEDEDNSGMGSTGALGEFASEALARALSNGGGFGIADRIIAQLSQRSALGDSQSGKKTEEIREIGKKHAHPLNKAQK